MLLDSVGLSGVERTYRVFDGASIRILSLASSIGLSASNTFVLEKSPIVDQLGAWAAGPLPVLKHLRKVLPI